MNKKAYRLIFSKARGMLVAVSEIVVGHVKGSTPATAPQVVAIDCVFTLFPIKAISLSACLLLGSALQLVSTQTQAQTQNLPTGGQVVGGAASIAQPNANKMEITQTTSKAVINWNTFNVGAGNTVQFIQPSSSSQVLNRVVGITGGSSQILGTLTANGQVFIVNPQGIVFGNGSMVNVGALLASTRDIAPNTFMAGGNLQFGANTSANATGLISNAGSLNASSGFVVLAADQIRNTGSINAPGGQVMLTAGDQATLSLSNGQLVQFTVNHNTNNLSIASNGVIQAQDGKIVLNANATNSLLNSVINLSGVVSAQGGAVGIDAGANGKVNLDTATVDVSRQGAPAGNITVSAQEIALANSKLLASGSNSNSSNSSNSSKGGTVILAGNSAHKPSQVAVEDSIIDVSANNFSSVGSVSNTDSKGGTTILSGNRVALLGNSTIDASGTHGGGAVIIGGDQLGKVGSLMPVELAKQTYIGSNTNILIGSTAGDGGFVETSGQTLTMLGNVKGSSQGKNGEWLIDPTDITINAVASANVTNASNVWSGAGTNTTGNVLNTSITNALATGTNVTVTTASSGTAGGNLTVAADLVVTNPSNSTLTLFANQTLTFSGVNVCATGTGKLGLNATAANGTLIINNTNVSLNGGTATLSGNGSVRNINGVNITGDVFFNGNDQISITGSGNSSSHGVYHSGNLTQNNGVLNITGANTNGTGSGVYLIGNVTHNAGTLNITGTNFNSTGNGVDYRSGFLVQNNGSLNLLGNSTGTTTGGGVLLGNNLTQNNGSINITGISNSGIGLRLQGNITQINGALNNIGTSNTSTGVSLSGKLTQTNGYINVTGVSSNSNGISSETMNLTQDGGSFFLNATANKTGIGFNSHITNITQNGGSMSFNGQSQSYVGFSLSSTSTFTQKGGTTNFTSMGNGVHLSNLNQINGTININSSNGTVKTGGNNTQTNGNINITSNNVGTAVDLRGNITQTNGYINVTGVSSTGNGIGSETMNLTQNGGSIFLNGTSITSGIGFNFYDSNITQNNGSISLIGQTKSVSHDGGNLAITTIIQNNGSMNIVGSGGGGLNLANVIQNNGSLNIAGNGTAAKPGITLNGNLSQTNGTLNITGSGNTSTGFKFEGNLRQTNGTLNITGGSNYSSGISLGKQTALGTNNTYNTTTSSWTNVTTAVNSTNASTYDTTTIYSNGSSTLNTTAFPVFNLTVANGNNLSINGNSVNGTGIEVVGLSNLDITAGTLVLNGSISSSQGSGVRLSGSQTNTTRVVTTGANTTTTTTNQSIATALNLLGAGNVTFAGSSASGAGVYLAGGNVTLNNAGTGSLNLNGTSTAGQGVQLGGVTQTTNTNTSAVNTTAGSSNTTANSSTQIGPYLNLIVAGSGSGASLAGTSTSGIGAYLGNVTFAGSALNISGSSNTGAGVQVGGLNSVLATPTTAVSNSSTSTVSNTVTTNTTNNVSLVADTTGNLTQNNGTINIAGFSNGTNGNGSNGYGYYQTGSVTQNNGSLNISGVSEAYRGAEIIGTLTQNNGSINIAGVSNSSNGCVSGTGFYLAGGRIIQNNGNLNISGISNTFIGAHFDNVYTLTQNNGSLNISGTSNTYFGTYSNGNLTQNNGSMNIAGASNMSYGVYQVGNYGNLTQANGSLNITGSSNASDGVLLQGNITQTSGSFNISTLVGNLNQSANINLANNLQLRAGTASAAGNTSGGNVNLGGSINLSNNGTLTIFSGNPNTAAYQANITGANSTGVYYKTYNASAANVNPVNGTQNYYYREAPIQTVTVNNKVYDTTTNASAVVSTVDGDIYRASGIFFTNASAGSQTVNSSALAITNTNSSWVVDGYSIGNVSSSATIAKANVFLSNPGTVSNKPYDGTTSATITGNSSGVAQLGNATAANGSLAPNSTFGPAGVDTTGVFASPLPGQQTVNLANTLTDTANYTLAGGSTLTTTAEIASNPNAQTVVAASSSSGFILQGLSNSGSGSGSTLSKADSAPSSAPSSASASSQGSSGSSAKEDQKSASAGSGSVTATVSPGGDVAIPAVSIVALAD
ncbi:ESPR-type extended signal peptide-containing protein [Polynucleobacter arcticus]|uniref:Filamentous haemagglutinin FhaB/tRNA nuclease CdiA-like TPS domain-containing protein n=1 Tax=Polynucleobacter arcticus TaxID=1743165 RepID=A0A6M9PMC0_9BURK|nr:ESPR-type extended signal peptide-containing protein [Polynucleobacter arcticus]QKM60075.1 hypothetical protein DN92_02940 [Polynucleobacter arcticus]